MLIVYYLKINYLVLLLNCFTLCSAMEESLVHVSKKKNIHVHLYVYIQTKASLVSSCIIYLVIHCKWSVDVYGSQNMYPHIYQLGIQKEGNGTSFKTTHCKFFLIKIWITIKISFNLVVTIVW